MFKELGQVRGPEAKRIRTDLYGVPDSPFEPSSPW
jgi:hypothetical protein